MQWSMLFTLFKLSLNPFFDNLLLSKFEIFLDEFKEIFCLIFSKYFFHLD